MSLLSQPTRSMLAANFEACLRDPKFDPLPLVRLFNPVGPAVWLATELYDDGDTLFGLADLGFGFPEMGVFSLGEIEAIRLPLGMRIERDRHFTTVHALSIWAKAARIAGSIQDAALLLDRLAGKDAAHVRISPR